MERFDPIKPDEEKYLEFEFAEDFTDEAGNLYDSIGSLGYITITDMDDNSDCKADMYDAETNIILGTTFKTRIKANPDGHFVRITVGVVGTLFGEKPKINAILPTSEDY